MAVIDTSMDMPQSCDICPNYQGENTYCLKGCFIPYKMFDMGDVRHKDCSLKSADEMLDEVLNVYVGYREAYEVKSDIVHIIHKYCDKEQKYGNND